MRELLRSDRARLFLTCWILFSAHFATNVVREHYPAFSLAEHGHFRLDEYVDYDEEPPSALHSDIFVHTDGHAYINNNVGASIVAAIPLMSIFCRAAKTEPA